MVCGGLRWFAVVWPFLTAHGHTDVLSSQILVVICGGLRWCVVVCGGVWWFVVICSGLSFSHTPPPPLHAHGTGPRGQVTGPGHESD